MTDPIYFLEVQLLGSNGKAPTRANPDDAGLDLYAAEDKEIPVGGVVKIKTEIAMAIPKGHVGLICDRSSKGAQGFKVMGGVIDSGYRGEVIVALALVAFPANGEDKGKALIPINIGDRIAQLLILPIVTPPAVVVDKLGSGDRGDAGFGSTGT